MPELLLDGEPATGPLWNRGLAYGDGVFETMVHDRGRAPFWPLHRARLLKGCEALGLAVDPDRAAAEAADLAGGDRCVIRITVVRAGGRGYFSDARADAPAHRIVSRHPLPGPEPQAGLRVDWARLRLAPQPVLAGIKHLNRLEQVLAAREAAASGWDELLLCDAGGEPVEAISGNLLVFREGAWWTPEIGTCGVAGVARAWLLHQAGAVRARRLSVDEVATAAELAIVNSVRGPRPVRRLGERELTARRETLKLRRMFETCRGW